MQTHPTIDKLETLRLTGMAKALQKQWQMSDINELLFEERLGLLVDREERPCEKAGACRQGSERQNSLSLLVQKTLISDNPAVWINPFLPR